MRVLFLASLLGLASTAIAGPLFPWRKTEKVDPKTRVPELVTSLSNDKDEARRSAAAVELRNYDTTQFPDIIPVLINALLSDPRPGVRIDAAQSLGKIRPINQVAGEALEQALEKDSSMRVRLQARSVLLSYQWAGYRGGKKNEVAPTVSTLPQPVTPPLMEKRSGLGGIFLPPVRTTTPAPSSTPYVRPVPAPPPVRGTNEPPLASPQNAETPALPTAPIIPLTPAPLPSIPSLQPKPLEVPMITPQPPQNPQVSQPPQPKPVDGPILP